MAQREIKTIFTHPELWEAQLRKLPPLTPVEQAEVICDNERAFKAMNDARVKAGLPAIILTKGK